jgi:hypothetical protein
MIEEDDTDPKREINGDGQNRAKIERGNSRRRAGAPRGTIEKNRRHPKTPRNIVPDGERPWIDRSSPQQWPEEIRQRWIDTMLRAINACGMLWQLCADAAGLCGFGSYLVE